MTDNKKIFLEIDKLIKRVDRFRSEPLFSNELSKRKKKTVSGKLSDNEVLKVFAKLIAYSQQANSELVEQLIKNGNLNKAFENFELDKVAKLNPCDIADKYWNTISAIRFQTKLFQIVTFARKLKRNKSLSSILTTNSIPKRISTEKDIDAFWLEFDSLQLILEKHKIPFLRSTTTLLHFLLDQGYDCIKPDSVVMKVSQKLGIVNSATGDKNFRATVKAIQLYCVERKLRPPVVDFYFLIDEGQEGAKKFVTKDFYK